MKPIDLNDLRKQFKGSCFYELIEHHLKKQNEKKLQESFLGTIGFLPPSVSQLTEEFIDRWNIYAYSKEFWNEDTSNIFDHIISDANALLSENNQEEYADDNEILFNLFQVIVLNFAYTAVSQPKMREFIGIKKESWFKRIFK